MEKLQPDFTKLFFDALGGDPAPIRYPLRQGPCLLHDVAFLSSLLHDARVYNPRADAGDGKLDVRFNRDCWELGFVEKANSSELHIADCVLRFRGVQSVEWITSTQVDEPWLSHVWVTDGYRNDSQFTFYLKGEDWQCDIDLDADDWSIILEDTESPYLWSARDAV